MQQFLILYYFFSLIVNWSYCYHTGINHNKFRGWMYVIYKQSSSIQEANHLLNRADSLIKRSTQVIRECSDETDYWANKYFEEAMRNIE